ncbi:MAG: hypothetical protein VW378_02805 [bacterium]
MTSLIWLIQILHYPSFQFINPKKVSQFSAFHQHRISWIVLPMMIIEVATLIPLYLDNITNLVMTVSIGLLAAIWASTFLLQVPCHRQLREGKTDPFISRLITTNWIRTLCWTCKTGVLCFYL